MLAFRNAVIAPLNTVLTRPVPNMTDQEREEHNERFRRQSPNVITLLDRLGYDIYDNNAIDRLRRNLEFSQELREQNERRASNHMAWIVGFFLTVLGSVATVVAQWISNRYGSGPPHP
jgi:hypothetical protein